MSSNEGSFHFLGLVVPGLVAGRLDFTASLALLLFNGGFAGNLSSFDGLEFEGSLGLRVGVKSLHKSLVLEGVFVGGSCAIVSLSLSAELGLNLVRVDDSGEVSACHHVTVELIARLLNTLNSVGSENSVEGGERILGEDHESAEVTSGSELEEVESVDTAGVDSGQVTGGSLEEGVLVSVNNKGTLSNGEAGVSHLVLTSASLVASGVNEGSGGTDFVEDVEESFGGVNVKRVNNEGKLGDGIDVVTTGKNERSAGAGSEG